MANTLKKLEDMNVMDDFLMAQLASNRDFGNDFCRRLLSSLLHKKLGRIQVISQKILPSFAPNLRGIRMDVKVNAP